MQISVRYTVSTQQLLPEHMSMHASFLKDSFGERGLFSQSLIVKSFEHSFIYPLNNEAKRPILEKPQ